MSPPARFDPGSFRDPDTKIFHYNGAIFRCLTARALADWTRLAATDFHARFMAQDRIVPTQQVTDRTALPPLPSKWVAVLEHRRLPMVSYPYEWSFGMLKDAALLQLDVIRAALDEQMTLKDATSFNVQWNGARPTFIDIGSFTAYVPGEPWAGYRQFCETFLYPLLLQAYRDIPFHPWLRGRLDGITAEQCRSLLSGRARWRRGVHGPRLPAGEGAGPIRRGIGGRQEGTARCRFWRSAHQAQHRPSPPHRRAVALESTAIDLVGIRERAFL